MHVIARTATSASPSVAIVMPVRDEAEILPATLASCVTGNDPDELIIVDGGSRDRTRAVAASSLAAHHQVHGRLLDGPSGRARQLDAGAAQARSAILLFLHADTQLPPGAIERVREAICHGALWGRFDIALSGGGAVFRVIETLMNLRSRLSGIATGDQAMFVRRDLFRLVGGFGTLPLMEDIDLARRLKVFDRPACLRVRVLTSSRRWEQHGVLHTVVHMWWLRLLFFLGVPATRLVRWYR